MHVPKINLTKQLRKDGCLCSESGENLKAKGEYGSILREFFSCLRKKKGGELRQRT